MSTAVTIRPGATADAALLAELGARTFRDTYGAHTDARALEAFVASAFGEDVQRAEIADPASRYLFAEVAERAAGFALLRDERAPVQVTAEHPLHLVRLYVDRPFQHQGVGKALMRRSLDEAQDQGADAVWLGVWECNPRAIAFYARWDFEHVAEMPFSFAGNVHRDLLFTRHLT